MGGVQEAFANFWKNPLGEKSAGDYFLFVGLLIIIVVAWTRIARFIWEA